MGPIAVGGLGGSGTRAAAAVLDALGVDIGRDLNRAQDDLLFTVLFKPLYRKRDLDAALRLARRRAGVHRRLRSGERPGPGEALAFAAALLEVARHGHDHDGHHRGRAWALERLRNARAASGEPWGWKEPNTHVFLPVLLDRYPDLRYLHLVRHGLDMAFSRNDTQLRIWGRHFGVPVPDDPELLPVARLRYWSAANLRARELAEGDPDRCLVVRFEDLCREPVETVRRVAGFCGLSGELSEADLEDLVQAPETLGRHRGEDLSGFDPADLEPLEALGYRS